MKFFYAVIQKFFQNFFLNNKKSTETRKWKYRTFIGPIFYKLHPLL